MLGYMANTEPTTGTVPNWTVGDRLAKALHHRRAHHAPAWRGDGSDDGSHLLSVADPTNPNPNPKEPA